MSVRRVLLVPSAYLPNVGGIEEVSRRLAQALRERGVEVAIATNRWPGDTPRAERIEGIEVQRVDFHLPAGNARQLARFALLAPASAARFVRLVRRFRPDVVHVLGAGPNAVYVAALRPLLGVPVVLGVHGELSGDAHGAFEQSATLRAGLRALCRSAAAVIAPSAYTLDELRSAFAVRGAAAVVPNGVDADELVADAVPRTDVLSVGRLVPQKGFDTLLEAFAASRDALGGRRLVLAGEGPERARLEAQARALGVADCVDLPGAVSRSELAALLARAEVFVLASRREAFGLAAVEAQAAGVPVVATAVGGVPEATGGAAELVPPDDAAALGAALLRVLSDEAHAADLRRRGLARAAELGWAHVVDGCLAVYEQVTA